MENITITDSLSKCQKKPETVDEFIVEISGKNISDDAILKSIKSVNDELENGNFDNREKMELTNCVSALKIILKNRTTKKIVKYGIKQ
jgi:hypothetical protein